MADLKPCHNCKHAAIAIVETGGMFKCVCPRCGARTGLYPTERRAGNAWNRRAEKAK
jgi:hypothetical protein